MMEYIYDAFISYRHVKLDRAVAASLQSTLEKYKLHGQKIKIFRDETELPTSSNLSMDIKTALEKSRFLIVICSATTAQSKWCMEEITYFKELHGGSVANILTLVTEGEPSEVFPPQLRYETRTVTDENGEPRTIDVELEPLAANVTAPTEKESLKKLKTEHMRIAAPLLGVGFDALYKRVHRRFIARVFAVSAAAVLFLAAFAVYSSFMIVRINNQRNIAEAALSDARALILSNAIDYARELNIQGARNRAAAVLLRAHGYIDPYRDDADALYAQFRDVAIDTLFYNDKTRPFARANIFDEVIQIDVMPEHGYIIATAQEALFILNASNGDILYRHNAPENDFFVASNIHGAYAFAVTDSGRVVAVNALTNEKTVTENVARFFRNDEHSDTIYSVVFNEEASALIITTRIWLMHGYFYEVFGVTPYCPTYISADDTEEYEKVLFTVIPFETTLNTEARQILVYKNDIEFRTFAPHGLSISANGRFAALRYNQYVHRDPDTGVILGDVVNAEVTLIDFNKFDPSLTPAENIALMTRLIDFAYEGDDYLFRIFRTFVNCDGIIFIDGSLYPYGEDERVSFLTRILHSGYGIEFFNEDLTNETTRIYHSGVVPALNMHDSHLFIYLHSCAYYTYLKAVDMFSGEIDARYNLPRNFNVLYSVLLPEGLVLAGRNATDSMIAVITGDGRVVEMQTLIPLISAAAFDAINGKIYIGYRDGNILMFNWGALPPADNAAIPARPPLQTLTRNPVRELSHNTERNLMFGMEGFADDRIYNIWNLETGEIVRSFSQTDFEGITRFNMQINSSFTYAVLEYHIDVEDIKYYVVDVQTAAVLYTYTRRMDANMADVIFGLTEQVFYGIGENPRYIWLFHAEAHILEVIDVSTGVTKSRRLITERLDPFDFIQWRALTDRIEDADGDAAGALLRQMELRRLLSEQLEFIDFDIAMWASRYINAHYFIGGDFIVFKGFSGIADGLYSFASERFVFLGNITEVAADLSAIYVGNERRRIDLSPAAMVAALQNSPFTGSMTEVDYNATGLGLFGD